VEYSQALSEDMLDGLRQPTSNLSHCNKTVGRDLNPGPPPPPHLPSMKKKQCKPLDLVLQCEDWFSGDALDLYSDLPCSNLAHATNIPCFFTVYCYSKITSIF
jgi:hypothetical protein